jgi:hypothetical protein
MNPFSGSWPPLKWEYDGKTGLECSLDLRQLFPSESVRGKFKDKLNFLEAPRCCPEIFRVEDERLKYFSEQLIPEVPKVEDGRKRLLLVLGNPASHSVKAGMFFASEGEGRVHRFWRDILKPALIPDLPLDEDNDERRTRLLSADYPKSDFRIGLAVFISFPSPASGDWSGIAGVQRLFGADAMRLITEAETKRILQCAREFLSPNGAVVSFNKLSWDSLRASDNKPYKLEQAQKGQLSDKLKGLESIPLFCVPPTRLASQASDVLSSFAESHFEPRS